MAPAFKRPGVPIFKASGTPGHGAVCCCYEAPAEPCPNCNLNQTPNGLEVTFTAGDLADHTCVDCNAHFSGTYILDKVEDADCYYTYCEDDPCNGADGLGVAYKVKILGLLSTNGTFEIYLIFGSPGDVPCNSLFDGLRLSSWTYTGADTFNWDCLDNLDHDASPNANDANIDLGFCHAAGNIHVRALN